MNGSFSVLSWLFQLKLLEFIRQDTWISDIRPLLSLDYRHWSLHIFNHENTSVMVDSLLKHVCKFLMNHCNLPVGDAEGLSVDQALDCCKLVQQHEIDVLDIIVDCIKVADKKSVFKRVDASLHKTEVHDTTAHFEQVFNDVISYSGLSLGCGNFSHGWKKELGLLSLDNLT